MKYLFTTLLILISCHSYSKSVTFESNYNYFRSFEVDKDNFYIGLQNGLVIQNRQTGESKYYNSINSNLKGNFIKTIVEKDGAVYIPTNICLNKIKDGKIENIKIGDNDVRDLHFDNDGNIWTFNSKSLLKYDGKNTKEWKISDYVNFDFEIANITLYKHYVWFSFYKPSYGYKTYYSNQQDYVFRFGLLDLNTNEMTTFTPEERGFPEVSIRSQTISNDEVWIFTAADSLYTYDIDEKKWEKNKYNHLLEGKYFIKDTKCLTDKDQNVWFTVSKYKDDGKMIRIPAVYDYKTNKIKFMYEDIAEDKNLYIYNLADYGDEIIMSGDARFYFQEGDSLNIINFTEFTDYYLFYSGIKIFDGEYFTFCTDWYNSYQYDRILNVKKKEVIEYTQGKKNELPTFSIERFVRDNNVDIIDGGPSIFQRFGNYLKVGGEWKNENQIGVSLSVDNLQFARFADNSLVINAWALFSFKSDGIFQYKNVLEKDKPLNSLNKIQIVNDKIYFYGSYLREDNIYNSFLSIIDKQGNREYTYDPTNSCLTDFKLISSGFFSYYIDSVANSMEIDNDGNLWVLTSKSLFKINDASDCEYITYIPIVPTFTDSALIVSDLVYSKLTNNMYGRAGNTLYNLNSETIDTVTVTELGYGDIKYFGKCSDGNVYITFQSGGLYRVNSIRDFDKVEIIPGKESDLVINHVSLFQDTLYLSTGIGLFKIADPFTSVEINKNEESKLSIFPNPTTDYITINNAFPTDNIQILSLSGRIVKVIKNEDKIDVSDLSAGVYIIKIGDKVEKFVKH